MQSQKSKFNDKSNSSRCTRTSKQWNISLSGHNELLHLEHLSVILNPYGTLSGASEHPDGTQQKLHGQNDELNQQLNGRPYHCTVRRKSFTVLRELEEHQETHTLSVNQKQNTGEKLLSEFIQYTVLSFTVLRELEEHQQTHAYWLTVLCQFFKSWCYYAN